MTNKVILHLDNIKNSKCIKFKIIKFLYRYNINIDNSFLGLSFISLPIVVLTTRTIKNNLRNFKLTQFTQVHELTNF